MPNARDAALPPRQNILVVGSGGAGKTTQILTLPGKKFAYFFDPAALASVQGFDVDYELFLPDAAQIDMAIKGFNKGSKDDKMASRPDEPLLYQSWATDYIKKVKTGFFADYNWMIFDSLTFLINAMMDRILWLNNRTGGLEEQSDYRILGNKLMEVFRGIAPIDINLYCTAHLTTYQDEKTKKVSTQLAMPGRSRWQLPLLFSNIWELRSTSEEKQEYILLTKSEPRGFQEIRTSLQGLKPIEDVTIKEFNTPEKFGIGRLLREAKPRVTGVGPISGNPGATSLAERLAANKSKESPPADAVAISSEAT